MNDKETIVVRGRFDFHYEVDVHHRPHLGFSAAYFMDSPIADTEMQKIHQPTSDDDREWESYQERFGEWRDEAVSRLKPKCAEYFNKHKRSADHFRNTFP